MDIDREMLLNALERNSYMRMDNLGIDFNARTIPGDVALAIRRARRGDGRGRVGRWLVRAVFPRLFPAHDRALEMAYRLAAEVHEFESNVYLSVQLRRAIDEAAPPDGTSLTPTDTGD